MGLFGSKKPSAATEAGNRQLAKNARKNAAKARRNGDHEYAQQCEDFAAEADRQADMARRLGQ